MRAEFSPAEIKPQLEDAGGRILLGVDTERRAAML